MIGCERILKHKMYVTVLTTHLILFMQVITV